MDNGHQIITDLKKTFGEKAITEQKTVDALPTVWLPEDRAIEVLRHLKTGVERPYRTLYDLTVIDERVRGHRLGLPESDFSLIYHLLSYERNEDIRIKVGLKGEAPSVSTVTGLWPSANWYEREAWDMFGVIFEDHPHLDRTSPPQGTPCTCH